MFWYCPQVSAPLFSPPTWVGTLGIPGMMIVGPFTDPGTVPVIDLGMGVGPIPTDAAGHGHGAPGWKSGNPSFPNYDKKTPKTVKRGLKKRNNTTRHTRKHTANIRCARSFSPPIILKHGKRCPGSIFPFKHVPLARS